MRFLRKLLLVIQIRNFYLHVKGVPLFFTQLLKFLNRPLPHVITDPVSKKIIDETGDEFEKFQFEKLFFLKSKPFGFQKTKKRGRVKRKIRRKIVMQSRVIDEA